MKAPVVAVTIHDYGLIKVYKSYHSSALIESFEDGKPSLTRLSQLELDGLRWNHLQERAFDPSTEDLEGGGTYQRYGFMGWDVMQGLKVESWGR